MTKVKFCGMMRQEDIAFANRLKPDYVGFIFAPNRRRTITPETARTLRAGLSEEIRAVGVFIREKPEIIAAHVKAGMIDLVQLHGGESEEEIAALRRQVSCPIIKAFRIESEADIEKARQSTADFILLDSGIGGTGENFDWNLIQNLERPLFLAGGMDAENVASAIARFHPFAVDVSSGIETDGVKDEQKMKNFMRAARAAAAKGETL